MAYLDYPGLTLFKSKLDQQLENELNTFVTKTMPESSVVTFEDGAEDLPLKELKVKIEPVQDLHGYDHPWVGGAGKNLFDSQELYQYADSVVLLGTNSSTYSYIHLVPGDYTISANFANNSSGTFNYAKKNSNASAINTYGTGTLYGTFAITTEADYRFFVYNAQGIPASNISNIQVETGSSATEYEPYSNICPISGFDHAEITRTGQNLFEESTASIHRFTLMNGAYAYSEVSRTYSFPCKASTKYIITTTNSDISLFRVASIPTEPDADNPSTNNYHDFTSKGSVTITTTSEDKYILVQIKREIADARNAGVEIAYADTYSISFPTSAGTVYGGELTINRDGSGELVVDTKTAYLSSFSFNRHSSGVTYAFDATISDSALYTDSESVNFICDRYKYKTGVTQTMRTQLIPMLENCEFGVPLNSALLVIRDDSYSDAASFNNAMSTSNAQLVYKLATPLTYSLTSTQVRSILGLNHVWADTGDIASLTYYKHNPVSYELVAGYDGDARSKAAQINIAAEENSTATTNHAAGDVFIVNDRLYEATTAITSGETITEGINVEPITLKEYADKAAEVATMEEIQGIISAYDA